MRQVLQLLLLTIVLSMVACNQKTKSESTTYKEKVTIPDDALEFEEDIEIEPPSSAEPPPPPFIEEVPEEEIEEEEFVEFVDQTVEAERLKEARPHSSVPPPPPPPPKPKAEERTSCYKKNVPLHKTPNWNTEEYTPIEENTFHAALQKPLSTFSIDVDNASYSNCRRFLSSGTKPPAGAVRVEEFINYFDYDYPQPKGDIPFSITTEIANCPWAEGHQLVHIGLQGKELLKTERQSSNLTFLIDVSGSMQQENKLPLLKQAFRLLLQQLGANDRVAIVVYAGASGVVLPSTSVSNKGKILAALDQLQAGGSTAGAAGIQLAYQIAEENLLQAGNNRIILATDGDFNVGMSSTSELVDMMKEKREKGIFLSVLGFGMGNYKDHRMEQIADNGNGNYAYIDNLREAKKVFVNDLTGTLFTIAKDVKIQIEFNPAKVKEYRLIGYENRKLRDEDFNNDKKDAGELGAGHTVTALYEIIPTNSDNTLATSVDDLKYQTQTISDAAQQSKEWMTVKLRYKAPDGNTSKLLTKILEGNPTKWEKSSENFRFSATVAGFALLLRNSAYKGNLTYSQILNWAKQARSKDAHGYRTEFVDLVELAASTQTAANAGR